MRGSFEHYLFSCCVVPEIIHTPPTKGIGISRGVGGGHRANPFHGGYGYFLELHIDSHVTFIWESPFRLKLGY